MNKLTLSSVRALISRSAVQANKAVPLLVQQQRTLAVANQTHLLTPKSVVYFDNKNLATKKSKEKAAGNKITKPKVGLHHDELNAVVDYDDYVQKLNESLDRIRQDFNDNLNLRATPSSFEQIVVKVPGGKPTKLGEIVLVESTSPNMFTLDLISTPDMVKPVYDALVKSGLCANPQIVDKTSINIPLAKLTREHRETMAKAAKTKCEQHVKRMHDLEKKLVRKVQDVKNVSDDMIHNVNEYIKYQFALYLKQAHDIRDAKIKEILQE